MQWAKWMKWASCNRDASGYGGPLADITRSSRLEVYFWIDYCSALQNTREAPAQIVPYMAALPAYVAVCAVVAAYWTERYASRAWCQAEMLMGFAFVTTGKRLFIVPRAFEHAERKGVTQEEITVPNPGDRATAQLTNEADRPVVAALTETARRSQAFTCGRVCARNFGACDRCFWMNVCFCCQCCGLLAYGSSRKVQPGKSTLTKITPAGPGDAPQPAEMARGPAGGATSSRKVAPDEL